MGIFQRRRVAQCWYTPAVYEEVNAMMEDGHNLPALHAHWLEGAKQREDQVRAAGGTPVRVPFDPAEFRRFCARFGVALDAKARSNFAALMAMQVQSDGKAH